MVEWLPARPARIGTGFALNISAGQAGDLIPVWGTARTCRRPSVTEMKAQEAIHTPQRSRAEVLDRLRQVLPAVLERYPVEVAYLYGSMARGTITPLSDIDLALVLGRPFPPYERLMLELEIQAAVEEASGLRGVEVRSVDAAPLQVRGKVLQEGIRLYERDRTRRVAFEAQTWKQYLDFAPIAHRLREAFLDKVHREGLLRGRL